MAYLAQKLGNYKFSEAQSFWLCVPIAVVMERIAKGWQGATRYGMWRLNICCIDSCYR